MSIYTATDPTPENPIVEGRFLATLVYRPLQGPERIINRRFISAQHDPHATAREAFGGVSGRRYRIRIKAVTARDLGMTRIPA